MPTPAARVWILAAEANSAPAVLMMEPAVDVILMFPLVTKALAPKYTLRPALKVMFPEEDVTLEAMVMSPLVKEVDAVRLMPKAVVTGPLITILLPALMAMEP